jgi:preprotein translocase SecF subunit
MNLGLDFTGGTVLTINFGHLELNEDGSMPFDISDDGVFQREFGRIRDIIAEHNIVIPNAPQRIDGNIAIQIRYQNAVGASDAEMEAINEEIRAEIFALYADYGVQADGTILVDGVPIDEVFATEVYVGPSASRTLLISLIVAMLVALVLILIYMTFRFKLWYGIASIIGLIHDLLIMMALTTIFRVQMNSAFVGAVVVLLGYSITNSIIVFDRARERIKLLANPNKYDPFEVSNKAVFSTMQRSITMSVTTLAVIVVLAILGNSAIREFAFPIIFGLLAGTYSSLTVAPAAWSLMMKKRMSLTPALADGEEISDEDEEEVSQIEESKDTAFTKPAPKQQPKKAAVRYKSPKKKKR